MRGVRMAIAAVLIGGCGFDVGGLPGTATPDGARVIDAAAPRLCVDDPDLVGCYRFEYDESGVQPLDESPYRNSGVATDVAYVTGHDGLAMGFGALSSARVPDSASLDVAAITLELWTDVASLPPAGTRAGFLDNDGEYGLFLYDNGSVHCAVAGAAADGLTVPLGIWTHLACTYDGATIVLYQDGVAGPMVPAVGTIASAPTDGLGIGQNVPDGDHLDGAIDDLRIWRVARTPVEIADDASATF